MQITIDDTETPAVLRAIIDLLTKLAALNDEADPMTARGLRGASIASLPPADAGVWQMGDNPTITDDELRDAPTLVLPRNYDGAVEAWRKANPLPAPIVMLPADVTPLAASPAEIFGRSETLPDAFKPGVLRETVVLLPLTSPPTVTTVTPPVDVDSAGQPWDQNIHSSSRDKIKDGTWRKRRNGPAKGQSAPTVPTPARTLEARPGEQSSTVVPPPPTAAAIEALAATIPVPPPPPSGVTFRSLVTKAAAAQAAGKVTPERIKELCAIAGAADLAALSAMPSMVATVDALLSADLAVWASN